jgi:hypothetical protein
MVKEMELTPGNILGLLSLEKFRRFGVCVHLAQSGQNGARGVLASGAGKALGFNGHFAVRANGKVNGLGLLEHDVLILLARVWRRVLGFLGRVLDAKLLVDTKSGGGLAESLPLLLGHFKNHRSPRGENGARSKETVRHKWVGGFDMSRHARPLLPLKSHLVSHGD